MEQFAGYMLVMFIGMVGLVFVVLFAASAQSSGGEEEEASGESEVDYQSLDLGEDSRITEEMSGVMPSGAEVRQAFIDTKTTSEAEHRDIAAMIEDPSYDALVAEFYDDSMENTKSVILDFNSALGAETFNYEREGVYVLKGEQLDGYPAGEGLFQQRD